MQIDPMIVEKAIAPLLGLPLWASARAGDMQTFQFGDAREKTVQIGARKGTKIVVGAFALHVQCAWRLMAPDGIWVASGDLFVPAGNPDVKPVDWDWMKHGSNRRDERIEHWFARAPHHVEGVRADEFGGLVLALAGRCALEVFPDDSLEHEHWRLLQPTEDTRHLVVTGLGLE